MTSPTPRTGRDQMAPGDEVPGDDRLMPDAERIVPDAGPAALGNGTPVPDDQRRIVPDDDPIILDEQLAADSDQVVLGKDAAAAADADAASPAGAGASPAGGGGSPRARWPEIQAMFVDDPRASVELAAGLTDDSVESLIGSLKQRQHALLSGWQGSGAGTEELRTALQGYRTFWKRLEEFSGHS